jgi:hypothetical protein
MAADRTQSLESIGLGGDGDEVDAILAVERHFRVSLDYEDAPGWATAGDVFASLLKALPSDQLARSDLWPSFAAIMCEETGADASLVGPETLLLGGVPLGTGVGRWLNRLFRRPV